MLIIINKNPIKNSKTMNKPLFFILILVASLFVTHIQSQGAPPASPSSAQVSAFTSAPPANWNCNFQFFNNGRSVFSNSVSRSNTQATRNSLGSNDNRIDAFSWSGTRCFCWVVVYQLGSLRGLNVGLWTDTTKGSYDLSKYITYDQSAKAWKFWDTIVSSYAIYCY